jgi:hypothetical protein
MDQSMMGKAGRHYRTKAVFQKVACKPMATWVLMIEPELTFSERREC